MERFDAANREDPRRDQDAGEPVPREWLYSQRMSAWLERLEPAASEELRLAVRAQHLCRWRLERTRFPAGRSGYLAWRRACAEMHAALAAEILAEVGYRAATITRVGELIRKRHRTTDTESQCLEDVACLVFLQYGLESFSRTQPAEKLQSVLRKTWRKMSPRAHAAAAEMGLGPLE